MGFYLTSLYSTCILIVSFLGINVLKAKVKNLSNLYFFTFSLSTVLWMFFLYLGGYYAPIGSLVISSEKALFFFRFAFAAPAFMLPSLLLFFYHYPKEQKLNSFLKLIIILSIFFIFIISLTPLVHKNLIIKEGVYVADEFGSLFTLWLILFQVYLLIIFGLAFYKTIRAQRIERKKLLIAMLGFAFFEIFSLTTNAILPLFNIYIFQNESILFTLFFAVPAFYSIQKFRFFNLSIVSLNLLRKIILFSLIILVVLIFDFILKNVYFEIKLFLNVLILVIGIYFYQKLENIFPEFVPQDLREFRTVVEKLNYKSLFYDDYQTLISDLEKSFVVMLNIAKVNLLLIREKKTKVALPIYFKNQFIEYLEKNEVDIFVTEEIPFLDIPIEEKTMILKALQELDVALCIPLFSEKTIIGIFVLGEKENQALYLEEEIESLLKLRTNLEICFMNILLKLNLKEENNLMKATIESKTKQIKKQYRKIQELVNQQSGFIAVTAHEFRTPLSIALFQLQDILESKDGKIKIEDLKTIEKSLNNLKKLTQNLFDVQQYDLNKIIFKPEKVNILGFFEQNSGECAKLAERKNIKCSFKNNLKAKVFCKIDKQQILQVLHNIFNNAVKFTPEGGKISVELSQVFEGVLIKIIDSGKGVADRNKQRIFDKFQTEKVGTSTGIGLGLYICKKIIDLHQGKIWVENTPGGGATFCVALKIA